MPVTSQPRLTLKLLLLTMALVPGGIASAQEGRTARKAITAGLSLVAAKRLQGAREFVALGEWDAALDALEGLSSDFGDSLVEVEPGRFRNIHDVCLATIAIMPPDGLTVYRARVDATAEFLYQDAIRRDDPGAMRELVHEYFPSSFGDDALWWLAEDAWSQGDLDQARLYWTQLVPLNRSRTEAAPLVLRYPDASFPQAEILARLVLCSVMQRDFVAAGYELRAFRNLHPDAEGALAGREGLLSGILQQVFEEARRWPRDVSADCPTFACRPDRNGMGQSRPAALQPVWQTSLAHSRLQGPVPSQFAPGTFPVVWNRMVLIQDGSGVRVLNLDDGQPTWPTGRPDDRGLILRTAEADSIPTPFVGIPRYSGTVSGGHYYARIGPPVAVVASGSLRRIENRLISLDLTAGEGRLEWAVTTDELLDEEGWRFTGAPLAAGERIYVTLRRTAVQVEIAVACIDAGSGGLIWRQPVAIGLDPPPETMHRVDHELLSFAAGSLYFAPQSGVVVTLDADAGGLKWVATYPSYSLSDTERSDPSVAGLLPPVFNRGIVYVAPRDAADVMAFDAATGVLRWRTPKPGRINALLGVAQNVLVAGGDKLWRFAADSGHVLAPFGYDDPAGFGCGRGAIDGSSVYWTTHEELFEVDIPSGQPLRRLPLALLRLSSCGNLVIADGRLLYAEPDRLTVFGAE